LTLIHIGYLQLPGRGCKHGRGLLPHRETPAQLGFSSQDAVTSVWPKFTRLNPRAAGRHCGRTKRGAYETRDASIHLNHCRWAALGLLLSCVQNDPSVRRGPSTVNDRDSDRSAGTLVN